MSAIITEKFRAHNANQFVESFTEAAASTYYLFLGKSTPFTSATSGGNDSSPPTPNDGSKSEHFAWDSMLGAKLISSSDVSFSIPRRNWANGTIYDMYRHDYSASNTSTSGASNLYDSTFYFVTSDYRIYKVLDNNGGTAYSGSEPTSESTSPFAIGGYVLKYMYKITASDFSKYGTTDFVSVATDSTVATAATSGKIESLSITAGSGYTDGTYYAAVYGDGTSGSTFTFSDADLTTSSSMGSGTGGAVEVIISPNDGHGNNAVTELGGHYVMAAVTLTQAEGDDFSTANDFRQVGIVVDPTNFGTSTVATATTRRQTYVVKLGSVSGTFEPDETITQATTGAVGKVVEWDSTLGLLYYQQENFKGYGTNSTSGGYVAFSTTAVITGGTSSASGTPSDTTETVTLLNNNTISLTSGYANPELAADSGDIIYLENRKPIQRASDQTEDIKIIIEF